MPRALTDLEVEAFFGRHPEIEDAVMRIDGNGYSALPLASPDAGLAIREPSGRYVLVWRDAARRWHFIDLSDMTLMSTIAGQINNPDYVSDPDYLGALKEGLVAAGVLTVRGLESAALVGILVLLFLVLKR